MMHLVTDSILNLKKYGNPEAVTIPLLEALWCCSGNCKGNKNMDNSLVFKAIPV